MKNLTLKFFLVFIAFAPACSASGGGDVAQNNDKINAPQSEASAATAAANDKETDALQKRIEQIAAEAKGKVGVAASILETSETASLNRDEHFPMQSVYKLPIAMAVLAQTDAGKLKLDDAVAVKKSDFVRRGQYSPLRDANPDGTRTSVRELLRLAVSESDGTASDVLLMLAGGAANVNKFLDSLKITEIKIVDSEKQIGRDWETQYRNWATPAGAIDLLRALDERRGLSETSQALLLKFLAESPRGAQRLKGLLPAETSVAHKTGTSGTKDGVTAATNDIGIIMLPNGKHLAIAVFVSDSAVDEAARERVIAEIARAAFDRWSGK